MEFEMLKSKYEKKSVSSIEKSCFDRMASIDRARREFIEALFYLKRTNRFRENPDFTSATFDEYLKLRFNMSRSKFEEERRIWIVFGDEAEKYGPGTVKEAVAKCGATKAKNVLGSFKGQKPKLDEVRSKIKASAKSAKPKPMTTPKADLHRQVADLQKALADREATIAEQHTQISKLKQTVSNLRVEGEKLRDRLTRYEKIYGYMPLVESDLRNIQNGINRA